MITVSKLSFDYQGHRALHDINFSLEKGSVTALVGPNGAGKTTLMRCIAGLETPLTGEVHVAGIHVEEHPRETHRVMGYLSDFFGLYQELTIEQCFEFAAASQGLDAQAIPHAIRKTIEQLELSDHLHKLSGNLSRGLKQRVAIGQAIIHSPKVLLLDEPASGLDPEARHSLALLFKQLQRDGMTLLVSSHILAELDEYSTHMLALRQGRIINYQALNHGEGSSLYTTHSKTLHIKLAQPSGSLKTYLSEYPKLELKTCDELMAEVILSGDANDQAQLLTTLVNKGLLVSSFAEHKENLQESYLNTIKSHTRG